MPLPIQRIPALLQDTRKCIDCKHRVILNVPLPPNAPADMEPLMECIERGPQVVVLQMTNPSTGEPVLVRESFYPEVIPGRPCNQWTRRVETNLTAANATPGKVII